MLAQRLGSNVADRYMAAVLAVPGLVGFWPTNGTSGPTQDQTRYGNHAVRGSSVTGQRGSGPLAVPLAKMDGAATVPFNVGNSTVLDVADNFTLAVAIATNVGTGSGHALISRGQTTGYIRLDSSNRLSLLSAQVAVIVTTAGSYADDRLHYLVATKAGATVKLYVDGVDRTGTVSNSTCISRVTYETYLGSDNGSGGVPGTAAETFFGHAGMFAIWNRGLSANEVAHLAAIGQGG